MSDKTEEQIFRDMEVGDKIWVENGRGSWSIHRFKRTTKTLLVTTPSWNKESEVKFDIKTGYQKGLSKWDFSRAEPFTDKHQKVVDKHVRYKKAIKACETLTDFVKSRKGDFTDDFVEQLEELI